LIFSFVGTCYGQEEQGFKLLQLHKFNYIHPYSYTTSEKDTGKRSELKYQFSFRIPLFGEGSRNTFFGAYTQKSLWQVFDKEGSRPFRETNYNPEVFYRTSGDKFFTDIGYAHESNGREDPESRSWDILFLKFHMIGSVLNFDLKIWHILAEDQGRPDIPVKTQKIQDFYGFGELRITAKLDWLFVSTLSRYNFSKKKGAWETDISFPMTDNFFLTFQYFIGYGDTLRDYNNFTSRYGVGVMLNR
jgi:phospholipase A1